MVKYWTVNMGLSQMRNQFIGKVAIVTGASSGIGEAVAREFAANGCRVTLAARSEEKTCNDKPVK